MPVHRDSVLPVEGDMRLLRVQVSNYPLLDDLDFELNPTREQRCSTIRLPRLDRPILFLALQWAFFGETRLPWTAEPIPCRPGSTDEPGANATARIDYSVADAGGEWLEYRLVRSAAPELAGRQWTSARTSRVGSSGDLLRRHVPMELRSSLFCSSEDGPFEWYGEGQPALSTQITGGPLAALRAVDSDGLECIGGDFNAIVSSPVFRSGFPSAPPISQAVINADGLLQMFDHQGGLLDPYFAQPGGVQCALNQALVLASARFAGTPTVFESPFAVYDLWTRQAMIELVSQYSLQAVFLLSEVDGYEDLPGEVVALRTRHRSV